MSLIFKNINTHNADISRIERLYISAFPEDERAPFKRLISKSKRRDMSFFVIYDDGQFLGFVYIASRKDLSYIYYLALEEDMRNKGYGTKILSALSRRFSDRRLFLAAEQPDESKSNNAIRLRRIAFYERCGFHRTGDALLEGSVVYSLLSTCGRVENSEYRSLIRNFAGVLLLIYPMRIIKNGDK